MDSGHAVKGSMGSLILQGLAPAFLRQLLLARSGATLLPMAQTLG